MLKTCLRLLMLVTLMIALSACAQIASAPPPRLVANSTWVVLPMDNQTETPQAGARAAAIAQVLLSANGLPGVLRYPADESDETLFEPAKSDLQHKALDWARAQHARYALTGSVIEWRYKVGVDGEPAIGMTLQLIEVESGLVLWSATGSRTGWSRDSESGVATQLEQKLLSRLLP